MSPPWGWYPPILTYHRVSPRSTAETPTLSPEAFERQMAILARRWRPIGLPELAAGLEGRAATIPRGTVAVTFDDGTDDTAIYAYPILRRHQIPATVFMIADNVGRPGFLTRDQLQQLQQGGVTIGSHTVHHAYLPSLPLHQARGELQDSKQALEHHLGCPVEWLSYPGGGFTPEISRLAREVGYRAACTTNRGLRRFPIDRWALRRITMHRSATGRLAMWMRCHGYYQMPRRLRVPA